MPRYSWNIAKVDVKHQSINQYTYNYSYVKVKTRNISQCWLLTTKSRKLYR